MIHDSKYFIKSFNAIKDCLNDYFEYGGTIHYDLKTNIKSDLFEMKIIENENQNKIKKLVYISLQSRLSRIYNEIIAQNNLKIEPIICNKY